MGTETLYPVRLHLPNLSGYGRGSVLNFSETDVSALEKTSRAPPSVAHKSN